MVETASILLRQPLRFAQGFALPFRGLRLMLRSKQVGGRSFLVAGLGALILLVLAIVLFLFTGDLLSLVWTKPEGGAWLLLWFPASLFLGVLLFLVGAIIFPSLLLGPLLDTLSAATEKEMGGRLPDEGGIGAMVRETARSTGKALLRWSLLLMGHGALLFLWLLPGLGPVLWSVSSVAWTLFWLACEYLDIAANRHGYSLIEVVRTVLANPGAAMGFGVASYLLLWIPILNLALIPFAVVGATILFVELRAGGQMLPPKYRR